MMQRFAIILLLLALSVEHDSVAAAESLNLRARYNNQAASENAVVADSSAQHDEQQRQLKKNSSSGSDAASKNEVKNSENVANGGGGAADADAIEDGGDWQASQLQSGDATIDQKSSGTSATSVVIGLFAFVAGVVGAAYIVKKVSQNYFLCLFN